MLCYILVLTFSAISLSLLLALLLFELHVAEVHDGSNYFIAAILLIREEAQDVHGMLWRNQGDGIIAGWKTTTNSTVTEFLLQSKIGALTSVAISSCPSSKFSTVVTPWEQKW